MVLVCFLTSQPVEAAAVAWTGLRDDETAMMLVRASESIGDVRRC